MAKGYVKNSDGSYSVNYNDQRFEDVKTEQTQKENQVNTTYDNILNNSDQYYKNQIDATKEYEKTQSELQQSQTDFAIEQINQQKEQAQNNYTKEQKGAYVDYMKQTKSNAQNMANSGLSNTGYSESSIVSMYNTYQNRVGTAKESLNQSILNYNNSIQQAMLANNEKLAEIAFNSLQTQNQLNQQAFEYKNTVILQKEQALQELNNVYYARYQDVLSQINTEIELQMKLDEIDRQYDQWLKEFTERNRQWRAEFDAKQKQWEKEYAITKRNSDASYAKAMSAIEVDKAQASYYRAQASSKSSSSNPYSNSNSTSLGTNAKKLLQDLQKAIKNNGKGYSNWKGKDSVVATIQYYKSSGKIKSSEADAIWDRLGY